MMAQSETISARGSARNDKSGLENLNDLAALVHGPAEKDYRSAIGSRARWCNLDDFALDMEDVAGTGRHWPAQLCSGPDNAAGERWTAFNIEAHRDRGGVPAARCQAVEERAFRGFFVRVKRLRIELSREGFDLRFIDCVRRAGKALPDMQIVKIEAVR